MSLYNMLFGRNPQSALLLAVLGFKEHDVPRLRDVHVDDEGRKIAVYTRMGGGNRGHWDSYDDEPGPDCPCPGCRANHLLGRHPLYLHDDDDDGDCTYATYYFKVPEEFAADVAGLRDILSNGLRKEFAAHLAKTLRREPTEGDKAAAAYDSEAETLKRVRHAKANGHTFVPYDDYAMETALKLAEANGGDLRTCWGILPLKLRVEVDKRDERTPRDEPTYVHWNRAEIGYEYRWEIDEPYWEHCRVRFADRFPVTMAKIADSVEQYRKKRA